MLEKAINECVISSQMQVKVCNDWWTGSLWGNGFVHFCADRGGV